MKRIYFFTILFVVLAVASFAFAGDTWVNGHLKDSNHDGVKDTWVDGYHRTTPNNTALDNYSTYPNVNPYTGKQGTDNPYQNNNNFFNSNYNKNRKNW